MAAAVLLLFCFSDKTVVHFHYCSCLSATDLVVQTNLTCGSYSNVLFTYASQEYVRSVQTVVFGFQGMHLEE